MRTHTPWANDSGNKIVWSQSEVRAVSQNQQSQVQTIVAAVKAGQMAKSEAIRQLAAAGVSRWDTSKVLGIKYQFVRNVLVRQSEVAAKRAAKAETK